MKRLLLVVGCIIILVLIIPYIQTQISERFVTTTDPKLTLKIGPFRNALKDFSSRSGVLLKNLNKLLPVIDPAKHAPIYKTINDSLTSFFPSVTALQPYFISDADKATVQQFGNSLRNTISDISKDILATKGNDATFKIKSIEATVTKIITAGNSLVSESAKVQKTEADKQKLEKVKQAQLDKAKAKAQKELEASNKKAQAKAEKEEKAKRAALAKAQELAAARQKAMADNIQSVFNSIKAIPQALFKDIFFLTDPVQFRVFLQKGHGNTSDIVASYVVDNNSLTIDTFAPRAQTTFSNIPNKVREMFQTAPEFTPGFYLKHLQSQLYIGRNLAEDGSITTDFSNKITVFSPYTYTDPDQKVSFKLTGGVLSEKRSGNCVAVLGDFTKTLQTVVELIQANTINIYKSEIFANTTKLLETISLLPASIQTSLLEQTTKLREQNLILSSSQDSKVVSTALSSIQKAGEAIVKLILKTQYLPAIKSNNEQILQAWEPDWFQYITNVIGVAPSVDCRLPIKMDEWNGPIGAFTYNDNGTSKAMVPLPDAFTPYKEDESDPYIPANVFAGRPIYLSPVDPTTPNFHTMIRMHDEQTSTFYKNKVKAILSTLSSKVLATAAGLSNPQKMQTNENLCGPSNNHAVCPNSDTQLCCNTDGTCSSSACASTRPNELKAYDGSLFINPDPDNYTTDWTIFPETYNEPQTFIIAKAGASKGQPFAQGFSLDGKNVVRVNSRYNAERMLAMYKDSDKLKPVTINDPENASGMNYWASQSYLGLAQINFNFLTPVIQVISNNQVIGNFRLNSKGNVEVFGTVYPTLLDGGEESGLLEVFGLTNEVTSRDSASISCNEFGAELAVRDQLAEYYRLNSGIAGAYWLGDSRKAYSIDSPENYSSQKDANANSRLCKNKDKCETNVVPNDSSDTARGLVRVNANSAKPLCYGVKPKNIDNKIQPFKNGEYSRWSEWVSELADTDRAKRKAPVKINPDFATRYKSIPKSLIYNNWRDWNSLDSFPIAETDNNIPYKSTLRKDPTRKNYFPFKIVTLEYLNSLGYITAPDGVNCDNGWLEMARIDIPKSSVWAAVGDHFRKYSDSIDPSKIPVLLVYNKAPYSIPIDAGSYSGISDSWKCDNPDQLRWSAVLNDQNYGPNSAYAVLGAAITRYSKWQNPIEERGYDKPLNAVNKLYLQKIGQNDWDPRWTMGEEHSRCGADHLFYFTTPFCTATVNSGNFCRWCNGNRPFWDIVPQTTPTTTGGLK